MVALRGARKESLKRGMVGVFDAVGFYALFLSTPRQGRGFKAFCAQSRSSGPPAPPSPAAAAISMSRVSSSQSSMGAAL